VEARDFSLLQNIQTFFGTHPASYAMGASDSLPKAKAVGA